MLNLNVVLLHFRPSLKKITLRAGYREIRMYYFMFNVLIFHFFNLLLYILSTIFVYSILFSWITHLKLTSDTLIYNCIKHLCIFQLFISFV